MNTTVKGCKMLFNCHKSWDSLEKTTDPKVRHCHECAERIYFCETQAELERAAEQSLCVAYIVDEKQTEIQNKNVLGRPLPVLKKMNSVE